MECDKAYCKHWKAAECKNEAVVQIGGSFCPHRNECPVCSQLRCQLVAARNELDRLTKEASEAEQYLEYMAEGEHLSDKTLVSLIGLDLPMSTSLLVRKMCAADHFDPDECCEWIEENIELFVDAPAEVKRQLCCLNSCKTGEPIE